MKNQATYLVAALTSFTLEFAAFAQTSTPAEKKKSKCEFNGETIVAKDKADCETKGGSWVEEKAETKTIE